MSNLTKTASFKGKEVAPSSTIRHIGVNIHRGLNSRLTHCLTSMNSVSTFSFRASIHNSSPKSNKSLTSNPIKKAILQMNREIPIR
ncbi:hypothetical protein COLO4_19794 [Corchorus olitorius]|uniref:Uncharacterized protein n=1 Tax=Corchorus olitorius TaxID=93759 RepID=A0A1R3J3E5_9ROSI|nr:hypothetical protein COLO4_19794 [Corchorus olitorius]